jgi:hypothetical protein
MTVASSHLVPQVLACERIPADEKRAELALDNKRLLFIDWTVQARWPVLCCDFHVNCTPVSILAAEYLQSPDITYY